MNDIINIYVAFYSEEVTLEELLPYVTQLSITWYELGQRLGLETAKLDTVKFAIGTMDGRCQKMLEMWVSTEDASYNNWRTFLNALKQSRSNAEQQVANEIYNVRSIKVCSCSVYMAAFISILNCCMQTLMELVFPAAQNKEVRYTKLTRYWFIIIIGGYILQEDVIVWDSWNFFLSKAG